MDCGVVAKNGRTGGLAHGKDEAPNTKQCAPDRAV